MVSVIAPLGVGLVPCDEVGGQAVELGGAGRRHRPEIGPDVAIEVLADEHELVAQRLDALARRLVLVDAGQPEVAQRPRAGSTAFRRRRGWRRAPLSASNTPRFSDSSVANALAFCETFSAVCRMRSSGCTLCTSCACDADRVELEQHVVVRPERVVDRAGALDARAAASSSVLRVREPRVHRALERRGVGHAGPERRAGRAGLGAGLGAGRRLRAARSCERENRSATVHGERPEIPSR